MGDRRVPVSASSAMSGVLDDVAVGRDDVGGEEAVGPRVLERADAVQAARGSALARAPAEMDAQAEAQPSAAARDSRSSSGEELMVMFGAMIAEIRPSALPCQASANWTAWRSWAWRSAGS